MNGLNMITKGLISGGDITLATKGFIVGGSYGMFGRIWYEIIRLFSKITKVFRISSDINNT